MPKTRRKRVERLNERQQKFVLHYCSNGFNAVKAMLAAGYSTTYALSRNTSLLCKSGISEAIEEVKSKVQIDSVKDRIYTRTEAFGDYEGVHLLALTKKGKQLALDAANTAIKGKARLFGLDLDHSQIDVYPGRRPDDRGPAVQASKDRLQAHRESQQIEPQTAKPIESVQIDTQSQSKAKSEENKAEEHAIRARPEGGAGG